MRFVQAGEDDVRWAAALAASVYVGDDVIPESLMLGWFAANPDGFSVIKNASEERVGNLDILPVRPDALQALIAGSKLEIEIEPADLFGPGERGGIRDLWLESVVCVEPGAGRALCECWLELLGRLSDRVRSVYAVAASGKGERLLGRLGFERAGLAADRRDRHDLYRLGPS